MTPEIDPIEAILTHLGGDTSVFADGVYRKAGYCNIQLSVPNVTLKTMLLFGAKIDCSHWSRHLSTRGWDVQIKDIEFINGNASIGG
jgi:hypothetical protein